MLEVIGGQTVWKGEVKVFDMHGPDKAKVCYDGPHPEGSNDKGERFAAVLQIPPVIAPETAVRASVVADSRRFK